MKKYFSIKKMISVLCALVLVVTAVFEPSWFGKAKETMGEVQAADTSVPSGLTEIGWSDFGLKSQVYSSRYANSDLNIAGEYTGGLNGTLLNGDIIMGRKTDIRFGAINGWQGLCIQLQENGNIKLDGSALGTITDGNAYFVEYTPSYFGLDAFVDNQFNLKISTQITGTTYTFGIWINDVMMGGYVKVDTGTLGGNCIGFYDYNGVGSSVILSEVTPEDYVELGWKDFGFDYKVYENANPDPNYAKGTFAGELNHTLFHGKVKMDKGTDIRYAGNDGWQGFTIYVNGDGNVEIGASTYTAVSTMPAAVLASDYGMTTFDGEEFDLKISTEILENGQKYIFGVWINDRMATGYFTLDKGSCGVGTTIGLYDRGSGADVETLPVTTSIPLEYREISWASLGLEYREYVSPGENMLLASKSCANSIAEMNRTLLNGDITMGAVTDIRYVGYGGWQGITLTANANGTLTVNRGTFNVRTYDKNYNPGDFGLTSFVGNPFNLKISLEICDKNYRFGIWINNRMLDEFFTLPIGEHLEGVDIGFYNNNQGGTVTFEKFDAPTNYTTLNWEDFDGLVHGTYEAPNPDGPEIKAKGTYAGSLHQTLLSDYVTMGHETDIRYAGPNGWSGFRLYFWESGDEHKLSMDSNGYGTILSGAQYLDTYTVDETIHLKISTEVHGNIYRFGIWADDEMLGGYITIRANGDAKGNTVGFFSYGGDKNPIILGEISTEPPTDFTTLIWTDFGLDYKEYVTPIPEPNQGKGEYTPGLNKTLLDDRILLGVNTEVRYGGTGWTGIGIHAEGEKLYIHDHWNGIEKKDTFDNPATYGLTSFAGEEFNLKISTEIEGTKYTFGIWINNELLDYYTLEAGTNGGSCAGLYHRNEGNNIILVKQEIAPPTNFTTLGWNDFTGLICKEYVAPNPDTTGAKGTYSKSLHQTLLDGNIIFGKNTDIRYGATGWHGIALRVASDGSEMHVLDAWNDEANKGTFKAKDFGLTSFADTEFNLKISTEVNGDSCTFGVWVNNQILGKYITLTKSADTSIGSCVGLYHRGSNNNIQLVGEKVPTDYTILTPLTSFGIAAGDYVTDHGAASVDAPTEVVSKFDKVILQFHKITYTGNVDLGWGGNDVWVGFRLRSDATAGTLTLQSGHTGASGFNQLIPTPITMTDTVAGVDLVGGTYNLKISMEYTDETIIKMGIWFDNILYNNEYVLVDLSQMTHESGDAIGLHLGVVSQNGGGTITFGEEEVTLDNFYWNLADGTYTLPTGAKYVEGGEVSELKTTGEHHITYNLNGKIYERNVFIWKIGDIVEDDKTNSCDLVRIKHLSVGNGGQTSESGKEAADFDKDDDIDATDVHSMRRLLVGDEFDFEKTVSEKLLSGVVEDAANVMPIVGFKGPSSPLTVTATNEKTYSSQNMVTADIYDKIAGLGINLITGYDDVYTDNNKEVIEKQLSLAEERNLAVLVSEGRLAGNVTPSSEELQACLDSYKNYKSFAGFDIVDEPKNGSYPNNSSGNYTNTPLISDWSALGKKVNQHGDLTGYVNLFPYWSTLGTTDTYKNYLTEYIEAFQPKYLSYDYYVFSRIDESGVGEDIAYDEQMKNLTMLREAAKTNNIPFWSFVQAGSNWNDDIEIMYGTSNNTPNKGEFNWQANIALAFGAKGISYFPLIQPHYFALTRGGLFGLSTSTIKMDYDRNGLIAADGSTTIWYDYAVEMNKQIASIDDVLMNATNKGLVVSGGTAASHINSGLDALCAEPLVISGYEEFTGVSTTGTSAGAAVGCFDYKGKTALYVVNYDMASSQTITLTFNKDVSVEVRQLQNGAANTATFNTSSKKMSVTLGAGEGALVVLK